ncbi:glycosyltransferase [Winogradskyella sp. PAMC22761]|nr:glycosyltransferase [Winogradskyella sp. PAMC22761]
MKILHILENFSTTSGGIRTVVKSLDEKLNKNGIESFIVSANCDREDVIYATVKTTNSWLFSSDWKKIIHNIINDKEIDLIHIHGVWMYPQYIAAKLAVKSKIPFIVTPHGMYEPWLWTQGRFKKKTYFNILSRPIFKKASAIHAITEGEHQNLKKLFPSTQIRLIPNLIDSKAYEDYSIIDEKYILFVGRIDEKKGIDILIKAFANLKSNKIKLKIAGKINDYKLELDKLIESLGIVDRVEFLGLIKGGVKEHTYRNAFLFVAPSHSEVIGMVNLEAAIYGVPVITTYQTGLKNEWSVNGGHLINPNEEELIKALKNFVYIDIEQRNVRGKLLHDFVNIEYSWENKIGDWVKLYKESHL